MSGEGDVTPYMISLPRDLSIDLFSTPSFNINLDLRCLVISYSIMMGLISFTDVDYTDKLILGGVFIQRTVVHPFYPGISVNCYINSNATGMPLCGQFENLQGF